MLLSLVISERNPEILSIWSESFSDQSSVALMSITARELMSLPNLDAILMMGMFAHERYGGKPRLRESQILNTAGISNMPRWVVTTPPLVLESFESYYQLDSATGGSIGGQWNRLEQETYVTFKIVFDCIQQFNQNSQEKIQRLGLDLDFLNFSAQSAQEDADAVHQAYLECISAEAEN